MTTTQYMDPVKNRAAVNKTLRHDEHIECTNATVICDKEGNVSGWFDNDNAVCFLGDLG